MYRETKGGKGNFKFCQNLGGKVEISIDFWNLWIFAAVLSSPYLVPKIAEKQRPTMAPRDPYFNTAKNQSPLLSYVHVHKVSNQLQLDIL